MSNDDKKIPVLLKELRLSRSLSVEELSKKSLVSFFFIKNLEGSNFAKLPSFVFSDGLLKNLLEFFKLNEKEIQKICLQFRSEFFSSSKREDLPAYEEISSQVPGESDDENKGKGFWAKNYPYLVVAVLAVVMITLLLLWDNLYSSNDLTINQGETLRRGNVYSLYEKSDTFDLELGDKVKIFSGEKIIEYELSEINREGARRLVTFEIDAGRKINLSLHREYFFDLTADGEDDLIIKYQKNSEDIAIVTFSILAQDDKTIDFDQLWNNKAKVNLAESTVLVNNHFKTPIRIFIKTSYLPVHLSYNVDGQKQNQINLSPYSQFSLAAENHLTLQIGNYSSTKLIINSFPINLNSYENNTFSTTKIIKWIPNIFNETKFDLIIKG